MKSRKALLFVSLFAVFAAPSCTTRYQDMLRDRDAQIRDLSQDVEHLRGANEELQRRLMEKPAPREASAEREPASLLDELRGDLGSGADVSLRRGRISIGVEDSVTFDSGSTALKSSSHGILKNVASVLRSKFSGRRILVEGHTDSDPIVKTKDKYRDNVHLSSERADAVRRYLIQQGVPESSMVLVGCGQFDPKDPKAKARNRRVEIVVAEPLGQ
ncbi:MAG: OmpA family protein [Planctomycetes bacterium]|nr:OmpA family protein [Planctomycetota bacterium]